MTAYVDEWIHACHVQKKDNTDFVVVKVHRHMADGRIVPTQVIIDKPKRSFYITKPSKRTHEFKKERESLENLDQYVVQNYRLADELSRVLNGTRGKSRYQSLVNLCNNQYVYGADIHIETLIKHSFQKNFRNSGLKSSKITTGFFDIETDVLSGKNNEPNIITVTHENKVYTAILKDFLTVRQSDGTFRPGNLDEFIVFSKKTLDHHIKELLTNHMKKNPKSLLQKIVNETPFEYFYYVGEKPIDLVRWIFLRIHENKTDFLGIWNLNFDIPHILDVIKNENIPYEDIICNQDLDKNYRYVHYQPDEKEVDNIYKKWHWLHATSPTQFIDSMCLYSILRTVSGKEASMSLNNVLMINDLGGKLTFKDDDPETELMSDIDWHRYMQKNEAYKYIVYNQFDCISIQLMEWKNNDISSMVVLGGVSQLCKWTRQTRKVADSFYFNALEDKMVTASPGQKMTTQYDDLIEKEGGAVLRPERTTGIGLRIFSDRPDIVTMLHNMVGDVDFSSMYPTVTIVCNIAKDTKLFCGITIDGMSRKDTTDYYSMAISLRENSVMMGHKYFGLPGYKEMDDNFTEYLKSTDYI